MSCFLRSLLPAGMVLPFLAAGCSDAVVDILVSTDANPETEVVDDAPDEVPGCRLDGVDDCLPTERCELDGCSAASGRCTPIDATCSADWQPQCGCDGRTYWNTCELLRAGVARNHPGACDDAQCGPWPGGNCPPGLLCATVGCTPGTPGVCSPLPTSCGTADAPACACDGAEYPDVCELFRHRAPMDHPGSCSPAPCAPECRDLGGGTFAWVDPCSDDVRCHADCADCTSICGRMGFPDEGWYAQCAEPTSDAGCGVDWNLIAWTPCGRP